MSAIADIAYSWLDSRQLPTKVDRRGVIYAPVEFAHDGRASRELRVGRTRPPNPLVVFNVHSADRIAAHYAAQVFAACNRWNADRRLGRVSVTEGGDTLSVVVGGALPADAATRESFGRIGDAVIESAVDFWRWVDLNADW